MKLQIEYPVGWTSKRLKYVASHNDEVLPESTDDMAEIDYVEISGVSLAGGVEEINRMAFFQAPSRARRKVRSGDILISTVRTYLKAIAAVDEASDNLIASTGFCVVRPREKADSAFLGWVAKSEPFVSEVVARSVGVSYPAINAGDLVTIEVPLPPLETQRRTARFLDEKTAQIDGLIEKKRALLDRLAEKRQALITRAVTKGLDPTVPMKPSGIDWLGDIPAHWDVVPLKRVVSYQEGPGILAVDFRDDGIPLLRVASIGDRYATLEGVNYLEPEMAYGKWGHFLTKAGDLLISASATSGIVSEVAEETSGCIPYTGIIRINPVGDMATSTFVRHLLVSDVFLSQIDQHKAGSTIQHFGPYHLGLMVVARPPLREQETIGFELDRMLAELHSHAQRVHQSIGLLSEYRAALITSAVTGQIGGLQ